jgi:hypothetical protein
MTFRLSDFVPLNDYEDIYACLAYGAEMSRERYIDIPLGETA